MGCDPPYDEGLGPVDLEVIPLGVDEVGLLDA